MATTPPLTSPSPELPARSATRCCSASPRGTCWDRNARPAAAAGDPPALKGAEGTAMELDDCAFRC